MKRLILFTFPLLLMTLNLHSQSTCAGAVLLTPGTQQCGTNSFVGSFPDNGSAPTNPCNSSYNDGEYWFRWTGTGEALILTVSGLTDTWSGIYVLSACPGSSPTCISSHSNGSSTANYSITTPVLTNGVTYYIVIANFASPYQTDFCLDAAIISNYVMNNTPVTTCNGFFYDSGGAGGNYGDNENFTKTFTPATAGNMLRFVFTAFETRDASDYLEIFNGPNTGSPLIGTYSGATSPGTVIANNATGQLTFRFVSNNSQNRPGWAAEISCIPPPPSNDECVNAIPLTVNPDYLCGTVTAGTIENATGSAQANGCSGTADDDVWYSFVATSTTHRVSLINVAGSTADLYHVIYGGNCGSLTEILCSDPNESNPTPLVPGNTYYVRVFTWTSTPGQTSTFDICIGSPPPPPPNDECVNAIPLTVNPDLLCGVVTPGYTQSATNSGIAACIGSGADDDVWFSFVATSTSHTFDILNVTGTSTDMVHEIFTGNCGGLFSIACSDPNSSQWGGFTIGQTYYVRVYTYFSGAGTYATSFNVCVGTPPPPPSNDEPCGATPLNVNSGFCSYQTGVLETSATLSAGIPAPGCGSLGADIWFTAVVPASGRLIVDIAPAGGPTDFDMAFYSAPSCAGPFTLIECDDWDSQNGSMPMICRTGALCTVPGDCQQNAILTPGQTIYIRVWEYGGNAFGPFDICAYEPADPGPPSNCASAHVIPSLPFGHSGQTTCCRVNSITTAMGCASSYQGGEDFLYRYTPTADETVDITVSGTLNYTGVFVTNGCPSSGGTCVASNTNSSGNPSICGVSLIAGNTYYIMIDTWPSPTCTPFNISILNSATPTCGLDYSISGMSYTPDLNVGTNIALPIDDRFSSSYISIGFPFCFDGIQYTQLLVSSNGYVIFDPIGCATNMPTTNAAPNQTSGWPIDFAIPNTNQAPRNCIMFPWEDINPATGGTIRYQVLGVSPNRRFVLTYSAIPYFSCSSLLYTSQLKLFETTNDIEVHIGNKTLCSTWNDGAAILGLHSYNGTLARVPAGYNYPTQWTASNQAWRFDCNCTECIALPVELFAFSGKHIRMGVNELTWKTASEENNERFDVERLNDNGEFAYIGEVVGQGNSNEIIQYDFTDNNAPDGIAYYRLKQVDFDGDFHYSQSISVNPGFNETFMVHVSPNPVSDILNIDISTAVDNATFVLISSSGTEFILKTNVEVLAKDIFTVDVSTYPAGMYLFVVRNNNNETLFTEKIVIR